MKVRSFLLLFLVSLTLGCGLYKPPLAPELLAPKAVGELVFAIEGEGLRFNWKSPDKNVLGEKLKKIDGYKLLRKGPVADYDGLNQVKYTSLKFISDRHLVLQKKLRDKAIEKGELTRNAKVPEKEKEFTYLDQDLEEGKFYSYKIVPVNQSGVEGETSELLQMRYLGADSKFFTIKTLGE